MNLDYLNQLLNNLKGGCQQSTLRLCFAFPHHLLKQETLQGRGGGTEDAAAFNRDTRNGVGRKPQPSSPDPAGQEMHRSRAGESFNIVWVVFYFFLISGCAWLY